MRVNPKFKFLGIIIFCLLHLYRDHLQIEGVHNWFTETGHEVKSVKHEKDGMLILGILAAFCLYFYEKDEEKEIESRQGFLES